MAKKRCRHHVNPLNHRPDVVVPDWKAVLARPELPFEVDVGCAKGTFLIARARSAPDRNLIGLEIRPGMAERVVRDVARAGLTNAFALLANANTDWKKLFPAASLERVYIHFPDPWFKKRHHKRRVVTAGLLDDIAATLRPGGELHFMTDFEEYAVEAHASIEAHAAFRNAKGPGQMWPEPLVPGVLSDREAWHMSQGDPVYRYRYVRV